jgi:DnaJ-domain-containing protein 1
MQYLELGVSDDGLLNFNNPLIAGWFIFGVIPLILWYKYIDKGGKESIEHKMREYTHIVIKKLGAGDSIYNENDKAKQFLEDEINESIEEESAEPYAKINNNYRVFSCPSCKQKIRIEPFAQKRVANCSKCKTRFLLYSDDNGHLYIEPLSQAKYSEFINDGRPVVSIEDSLAILELTDTARGAEIKRAYKKKMMEYHPDKVANLGKKLRSLAEHEAKNLNAAIEILKKNGYL